MNNGADKRRHVERISATVNEAPHMTPELDYYAVTLTTARAVLAMQASSAASERGGSVLTRLITPERTWLAPATVKKLALLRSWLRTKWARKARFRIIKKTAVLAANAGAGAAAAAANAGASAAAAAANAGAGQRRCSCRQRRRRRRRSCRPCACVRGPGDRRAGR
jgi:hypothetical protein